MLGLAVFNVGSFKCLAGWSYFEQLLFVTLAPFIVVPLVAGGYWITQRRLGKLKHREILSNITYWSLFFIYIVLPSISTFVITYFSCARFDRGDQRDLRVIAVETSIKCTSKRYQRWAPYAATMIAVWPVGTTLGIGLLLWQNRERLDPVVLKKNEGDDIAGLEREERHHRTATVELIKLKQRNADGTIVGLEFLIEEFTPRCYFFPVFELARRLFLSSVLAVFYPGSAQQLVVGVLGAMGSYVVYSFHQPYINDDDNVVAIVSAGQLVLLYFAALAVYTSDVSDQKRGTFTGVGFGAVLVVIFFAGFLVAAYVTVLDLFGYSTLRSLWPAARRPSSVHVDAVKLSWQEDPSGGLEEGQEADTVEDEQPPLEAASPNAAGLRGEESD